MHTENAMVSARYSGVEEEDDGALSHPELHEEDVLLTPALLAVYVENAIGTLMARSAEAPRGLEEHATACACAGLKERG
jgi:hypothetical protein